MNNTEYYDRLGVSKSASQDEIKSSFRKLAKKYHPDVSKEENAAEKFKEAQEAYSVLSDADKRANYDRFGHAAFDQNAGGFVGDGIVFVLQNFPMYVINDENFPEHAGKGINMGYFGVLPLAEGEVLPFFANSGNIEAETYGDWIQLLVSAGEDITEEEVDAVRTEALANTTGALMFFGEDWGYDVYMGAVNKLFYQSAYKDKETGEEIPAVFAADVTWANVTAEDRIYGFKVDMDVLENEQKIKLVTPYDYSKIDRVFDVNGVFDAAEEAPAKVSARTPKLMNSSYRSSLRQQKYG